MEFSVKKYSWRELELLTDSFSEKNFIGNVKHGKVYRGKTEQGQVVTVKIWFHFESQNRESYKTGGIYLSIYITLHTASIYLLLHFFFL